MGASGGRPRRRQAGSGWLELAAVAVLLSVLAGVLLSALRQQQALAEKTAVEMTIMNMRSGLRYRIVELILAGRTGDIAGLAGANPVAWLSRPPEGYLGEAVSGSPIPPGSWRFDRERRELVYRVVHEDGFLVPEGGNKEVRLRVVAVPGSTASGALLGVSLQAANRYAWP